MWPSLPSCRGEPGSQGGCGFGYGEPVRHVLEAAVMAEAAASQLSRDSGPGWVATPRSSPSPVTLRPGTLPGPPARSDPPGAPGAPERPEEGGAPPARTGRWRLPDPASAPSVPPVSTELSPPRSPAVSSRPRLLHEETEPFAPCPAASGRIWDHPHVKDARFFRGFCERWASSPTSLHECECASGFRRGFGEITYTWNLGVAVTRALLSDCPVAPPRRSLPSPTHRYRDVWVALLCLS